MSHESARSPSLERYRSYLRLLEAYHEIDRLRGKNDAAIAAWLRQVLNENLLDAVRTLKRVTYDARTVAGGVVGAAGVIPGGRAIVVERAGLIQPPSGKPRP